MYRALLLSLLVCLFVPPTAAQTYEPARGTAERQAILDAVRAAAASHDGTPTRGRVVFHDVQLRASGSWAFLIAGMQTPSGATSDHCARAGDGDSDAVAVALVYRDRGTWHTVDYSTCMTDVGWGGPRWSGAYGAPAALNQMLTSVRFPAQARTWSSGDGFLSLRSEPSVRRGQRIARMPDGTRLTVQSCNPMERVDGDWGRWCRVRTGSQSGWAFSHYLSF